ncbi:MAG: hypothetical protein Q4G03_09660 [Planctomycetia bacterium]|nr:hypothetical protein [Planctomycetia bacterium]
MSNALRLLGAFAVTTLLFLTSGCSNYVHVDGTVAFQDGAPLSTGTIYFTDGFYLGRCDLDKHGHYSLHTFRRNDGVPKGVYRVYITGAFRFTSGDVREADGYSLRFDDTEMLIDMQYTTPDTSGWVVELKKNTTIDFTVYTPGKVPEEERNETAKLYFDPEYRKARQKEGENNGVTPSRRRLVNPALL